MITMKMHIKSISNSSYVEHKMKQYSYAFRLLFTMLDEACDPIFEDRFKNRFELNDIEYRSLLADVKSFRLRAETQNEQRIGKIEEIRELLEISFNDKCDLTSCVLDGKKTQLRKGTNYCCTDELKHLPKPIALPFGHRIRAFNC